jgi:hypothetical protein
MLASIAVWQAEHRPLRPQREARASIPGEDWEEKYDRLYRESKPREQFRLRRER